MGEMMEDNERLEIAKLLDCHPAYIVQSIEQLQDWLERAEKRIEELEAAARLKPVDIKRESIAGTDTGKPLPTFPTFSVPLDGRYQWVILRDDYNGENSQTRDKKVLCVLADGTTETQAREYVQRLMDKQRAEEVGKMVYPGEETYYEAVYTEVKTGDALTDEN